MILGHLTVTAAGYRLGAARSGWLVRLPLPLIIVGAYLPDLIDKSLNWTLGLSGRGYAHSIVVQVMAFSALAALAPRRRRWTAAVALGAAVHALEDWVELTVLLAPLLGPIPVAPDWGFWASIVGFYRGGGPQVWLEVAALVYWTAVGVRRLVTEAWAVVPAAGGRDARPTV
jgi:membrane-bound metal-dependent hydrolase YbcI (DUF457 family)